ncbi:MAG: hypothetical protein QOG49_169 [Frankiaceae bacterium]|nr:hypothetical protein [Frankiaceae bacterium]
MAVNRDVDAAELADPGSVSAELADHLSRLIGQLAPAAAPMTADDVRRIVQSPATRLVLARDATTGRLIGMLTLVVVPLTTGIVSRIEDVVVDESERGRGVGEALLRVAVILARESQAGFIELTSRPAREAANRLYERFGFVRRETNVYRLVVA